MGRGDAATAPILFGAAGLDARLRGGLARGSLHEVYAGEEADASSAAGFAGMLAIRACDGQQPILWVREERSERTGGRLHAPGLLDIGIDPARMLLVSTPDLTATLRAGAEALRSGAVGVTVVEPWGKAPALDLTASRRLLLAAERSGVTILLLRIGAEPGPSAARTRWQVRAAPSVALAANAPGHPAFDITLLRHRGGVAGFAMRVEWDRDRHQFHQGSGPEFGQQAGNPPLSGAVPADAAGGAGASMRHNAA